MIVLLVISYRYLCVVVMECHILTIGKVLSSHGQRSEAEQYAGCRQNRSINDSHRWTEEPPDKESDGHGQTDEKYILVSVLFFHRPALITPGSVQQ